MTPLGRAGERAPARTRRSARLGGLILLVVSAVCVLGPALTSALGLSGTAVEAALGAAAPSLSHPLGTDVLGRDLLVRTLEGGRVALLVGVLSTAVALVLGVTWGATAGWAGGRLDALMMRLVDVFYALPTTVFVIATMAVLETRSTLLLVILVGSVSWLTMARIVRAEVRSLRTRDFVVAARATGATPGRIVRRHVLPNLVGPVVAYATTLLPVVLLTEAFLSFLGLGVAPPQASWGTLVHEGADVMVVYPWTLIGPAAMMAITILGANLLGDGLRDATDRR